MYTYIMFTCLSSSYDNSGAEQKKTKWLKYKLILKTCEFKN